MQSNTKRDYIVKGNRMIKPLPPIGYNHDEEDAQLCFHQMISGNMNIDQISDTHHREVRIFLSSTFSDFKVERNLIIKKVLPEIKPTCDTYGLDLRFCDMRWGVTDSVVNEHFVQKLCINEIEICRKNSIGPFFVLLLGNRYGYRSIPSEIVSSELELLYEIIQDKCPKEIELFNKWYKKDENAQPAVHILLPIRSHLPHYADYDDDVKRRESGNEWWSIEERIRRALRKVSKIAFENGDMSLERMGELTRSVTETELWSAITKANIGIDQRDVDRCLIYERQLSGLAEDLQSENAAKHIDCVKIDEKMVCDMDCLRSLREFKKRIKKLGPSHYRQFSAPWSSNGICEDIVTHESYLDKLCKGMIHDLKHLITARMHTLEKFTNRFDRAKNNLQSEVVNHWLFCRQKSRMFCGRKPQIKTILKFVEEDYRLPVIIHGDSGSGKTSFLSKVASDLQMESFRNLENSFIPSENKLGCFAPSQSPVIILRFLGTSASSSTLQQLLFSVCFQIQVAYKMRVLFRKMSSLPSLQWLFHHLLVTVSRKFASQMPLVIILDSLDQLLVTSPRIWRNQRKHIQCSWIPLETPRGVHLIISIATDSSGLPLFQSLTARLNASKDNFIEIDSFKTEEINSIVQTIQEDRRRSLTPEQMDLVLRAIYSNPEALFIKITLEETLNWKSFLPESEWLVANTTQSAVQLMFSRLENRYGEITIRYILGYLTLGLNGLSELEIEDLLSLQDLVLNEVYQYHDPPIKGVIRIPSLLWARIHSDLSAYIVEKGTDGMLTLSWYHRQFHLCALDRYVIGPNLGVQLHTEMANYFSLESSYFQSCTLRNSKRCLEIKNANRLITCPPVSNKQARKLHAISYHLIESGQDHKLAERCVASLHYLTCYLQCFGIQELVVWLKLCSDTFPKNLAINIIKNCVVFIQSLLESNSQYLPAQLLGQLYHLDRIILNLDMDTHSSCMSLLRSLCNQCRSALTTTTALIPSVACLPSSLGSLKLYKENIERVITAPWNPTLIILVGQMKNEWVVRLFNSNDRLSLCTISCENQPLTVAIPSVNQSHIFIQDCRQVLIHDADTGHMEGKHVVTITNKTLLTECMAVDSQGRWIAMGAQNKIALLEYRPSSSDKCPLWHKGTLTAREVDKTISLCFIQSKEHSLLLSSHNYHSKSHKTFLIKLWQFEQNNELWSYDLASLNNKYSDFLHLWPIPQSPQGSGIEQTGSTLIILPNGSCFMIMNIFDCKSLKVLAKYDSVKSHKERLQSLTSNEETVTITTKLGNQTMIHTVDRQGALTEIQVPDQIPHTSITCAMVDCSTNSLLLGLRSGNVSYIRDGVTTSWRSHRSSIDYLSMSHDESRDPLKVITFSLSDKVLKFWTKTNDASSSHEIFARTIFEEMNAFTYSLETNSFVILDANFFSLHHGTIDTIGTDIRYQHIAAIPNKSIDGDQEPESMLVIDLEIVMDDQAVLVFFDDRIQLYNIIKFEFISNLDLSLKCHKSKERCRRNYWHVMDESSTLVLLTHDRSSNYFHLESRPLPSICSVRSTKMFLAPVNMNSPLAQLEKIALISTNRNKFLIILWKNNKPQTDSSIQDLNSLRSGQSFLCSSLNYRDSAQILCLIPCCNPEESKKTFDRKTTSKVSNQPIFSYAIPHQIPDIFPAELLSGNTILIGGLGEIFVWDLMSGICRVPKVPYFQSWFKHSVTINSHPDFVQSSEGLPNRFDGKHGKNRSIVENSSKDFSKWPITSLLISRQSTLVISGCAAGYIIVWRWSATLALCGMEPDPVNLFRFILSPKHADQVNCLALSQDLRLLASGSADMIIYLFDIRNHCSLHQINVHCSPLSLSFCSRKDGKSDSEMQESFLVCHSVHIGQNRMMLFDVVDLNLASNSNT